MILRDLYELFIKLPPVIEPVADPPPWDVPLDQTSPPMHTPGDTTSV